MSDHSPLGASSAHRWMECPGSVGLSYGVSDPEDDTFSKPGTVAHALGELCLKTQHPAWQRIGDVYYDGIFYPASARRGLHRESGVLVDKEMADAVQVYLDFVEETLPWRNQSNSWPERKFKCPTLHKYFWGMSDLPAFDKEARTLHVVDYKHGAGIVVEVKENPQEMYYACGALEDLKLWAEVDTVVLHIIQPRAFHPDGVIRSWTISTRALRVWLFETLLPAMDRALVSRDTRSGDHCRFCPVRFRACPQLVSDMTELEAMIKDIETRTAAELTHEQVACFLDLVDIAKIVGKAVEQTAFARLNAGHVIPGRQLSSKRSNRIWKEGAEEAATEKFGKLALTKPELKSPAQIDELPMGGVITARWAFKQDVGLTVTKVGVGRPAINVDVKSMFQPVKRGK